MNSDFETLFTGCVEFSHNSQNTILTLLPTSKGVSFFVDIDNNPIQLLLCNNIRSTVKTKLFGQPQQDSKSATRKIELSKITSKIYFTACYNNFCTYLYMQRLAREIYPKNPSQAIELANLNIVTIDTKSKWPNFKIAQNIKSKAGTINITPFPSRKAASVYIETLIEVFDLCKNYSAINSPEKAKSCPYLQMKSCDGVCVNNSLYQDYIKLIHIAIETATHDREVGNNYLIEKMRSAAKSLDFESANKFKQRQEKLSLLNRSDYKWTKDLSQLELIHIDRSAKIKIEGKRKKLQSYSCFYFKEQQIFELKDFTIDSIDSVLESIQEIHENRHQAGENSQESLQLISYFLNRSKTSGIWIDASDIDFSNLDLAEMIETLEA